MHPLTTLVLATIFSVYFAMPQLDPHRTVLNLTRFSHTAERPALDPSKPNVTLGFLTSFKDIEKLLIAGAVPLAVDLVNEDPDLLPTHNLKFIAYDSGDADSSSPLKKMTQMREEGVIGFIGLDGSCEHEALLAAAWDMSMVSYVSHKHVSMFYMEVTSLCVSWK
ncbi:ANF_receptor domain-containing protein [Caerostris darwini]|uniref:ANF_receptor domain-containing protein n=1 Tax=Caerostris darwini TaxID=1538125 RepID=A0AAV4WMB1_9ARAC|nr:ANF_receptor domain-containing protein [Caerostris darwini]